MAEKALIDDCLEDVVQSGRDAIAHAVEDVARRFISGGGYGSFRMHLASNEVIMRTFRSVVGQMSAKARSYEHSYRVRHRLDSHLSHLIERTVAERRAALRSANATPDDSAALCASLMQDMKHLKDAAIREFPAGW
jgi:hypothetical protein